MKCHAGVEFEGGKPCPKCHAKLGEVCWPGINADLLELAELRKEKLRLLAVSTELNDDLANAVKNERQRCIDLCEGWIGTFQDRDIQYTSAREYAIGAIEDIVDLIREGHSMSQAQGDTKP